MTENWHTWYLGGVDSKSGLKFLDSDPKINFWANLAEKVKKCRFSLKTGTQGILEDADFYSDISFLNFQL